MKAKRNVTQRSLTNTLLCRYSFRMKKILFLDDDKSLCTLLGLLMEELGYTGTSFVHSFTEMVNLKDHIQDFDIIFLDVNLGPHVPNGIDAFDWLKENHFVKKIIFFTGHAHSFPIIQKALDYPNVFILEKPVAIERIQEAINN